MLICLVRVIAKAQENFYETKILKKIYFATLIMRLSCKYFKMRKFKKEIVRLISLCVCFLFLFFFMLNI